MNAAERPPVLFRRIDDTPTGVAAYRVGPPHVAALWQPTPTLAPAAGRLHEVACCRGCWVDVSGLRTDGTLEHRRKNIQQVLKRVARQVEDVAQQLGVVLVAVETQVEDGRVLARVLDRVAGVRIET